MAEMGYIKKEDALVAIRSVPDGNWSRERYISEIVSVPAADVLPVVHAKWIIEFAGNGWNEWDNCTCPVCRVKFERFGPTRFCPNCGAKMTEV